jgi:O-acetyl-ADP-ribose deacetylase (regulator of RNase III)
MDNKADEPTDDAAAKKPFLLDRIATSDGFKDAAAHTPDADGAAPETAADAAAAPKPTWRRYVDEASGKPYWHNAVTKKTTWADPAKEASSGEDASPPKRRRTLLVDNLEPLSRHALAHGELVVSWGSVLAFRGSAMVNAANEGCQGGGGVDGAITSAGGDVLAEKREALPCLEGSDWRRCVTGDAVATGGGPFGSLQCDCVVHAVGPNYNSLDDIAQGDALLKSAYVASMARAQGQGCTTVAFSLLSAGIFRGRQSLDKILEISVGAVADGAYEGLERVHLVAFTPGEQRKCKAAAAARFAAPEPAAAEDAAKCADDV